MPGSVRKMVNAIDKVERNQREDAIIIVLGICSEYVLAANERKKPSGIKINEKLAKISEFLLQSKILLCRNDTIACYMVSTKIECANAEPLDTFSRL